MRKILSAALALVCIWFASPAHANCNLFDSSWLLNINGWTESNGVYSGPTWRLILYINDNNGLPVTIDPNTQYTISATFGNNDSSFRFGAKYTDGTTEYQIGNINNGRFSFTTTAGKQVASLTATYGSGASNVELSNIQIERGDTATAYTPYNPLCATCDGTIVNYTSATGTVSQSGTPTPTNPIYPTFYQQGNMVLRKVGNYADSYDATTGKITRRVAVVVFDGTESWAAKTPGWEHTLQGAKTGSDGLMLSHFGFRSVGWSDVPVHYAMRSGSTFRINYPEATTAAEFKSWLAQQYANGTPVTVWYPLAEPVEEDWTETSYCETPIKIATTKYNESAFGPLNTALQNAISVVDSVVSNTITQAGRIATLQAQKQTRPADDPSDANNAENCPAGKKCLLVTDENNVPHWYEIVTGRLPNGYTELQWIESTGTQYIDTGITNVQTGSVVEVTFQSDNFDGWHTVYGNKRGSNNWIAYTLNTATQKNSYIYGTYYDTDYPITTDKHTIRQESNKFYLDGTLAYTAAEHTFTNDTNLLLFARASTNAEYMFHGKIYAAKIWNDGTMVGDFVPARRNSDNVLGMYDTVSGTFFTNAGTGEFTAGDPVVE